MVGHQPGQDTREEAPMSSTNNTLPELIGSEKQISWAVDIRDEKLAEIENALRMLETRNPAEYAKVLSVFIEIRQQADAKFWIDRRARSWRVLMYLPNYGA